MAFKIAYCAGHYIGTAGKRVPASLDKNETREWVLNDRIADHFAHAAMEYDGVEILRTDDPTGKTFIDIPERTAKANAWGADLYLDIHHNAAKEIFSGGGVEAYSYPGSAEGEKYRDAIYAAVIAAGGLKGNRATPLQEMKYDTLRLAHMTAVLIEYGYMNSRDDAPVILTDSYSKNVAYATMEGIAKAAGLKKLEKETETATATATEYGYAVEMRYMKNGCKGEDVKALQILLIGRDYNCGDAGADGDFGSGTYNAVCKYQESEGLEVDGVVGHKTMKSLLGV